MKAVEASFDRLCGQQQRIVRNGQDAVEENADDVSYHNVLSLFGNDVKNDDDNENDDHHFDQFPDEFDSDDDDDDDRLGPLTPTSQVSRSRLATSCPFKPNWTLTERSCSLYSDALNQIMVNRGMSSASSINSSSSPSSPSSRRSSSEAWKSAKSDHSSNDGKVRILPNLPSPVIDLKCSHTDCSDAMCPNARWPNITSSANNINQTSFELCSPVYVSNGNVIRVQVNGERNSPVSPTSLKSQGSLLIESSPRPSSREDPIYQKLSASRKSYNPSINLINSSSLALPSLDTKIDPRDQRTWRQCKHSTEVILVSSEYSSSPSHQAKRDSYKEAAAKLTADQELTRHRRQYVCEAISLILMLIAVFFLICTPVLLVPIWAFPEFNTQPMRGLMWLSLLFAILFTIFASLVGNVYWYYDQKTFRLKWRLHCGSSPRHLWGSTLFNFANEKPVQTSQSTSVNINI